MTSILLALLIGQLPPQAPPLSVPPQAPPPPAVVKEQTYAEALEAALQADAALVVGIRCEAPRGNWHTYSASPFDLSEGAFRDENRAVLYAAAPWKGAMTYNDALIPAASWLDVLAEVSRVRRGNGSQEVRQPPLPFADKPSPFSRAKWYPVLAGLETVDDSALRGAGLVPYARATRTQLTEDRALRGHASGTIHNVSRYDPSLPAKWHQPGGLQGVSGYYSNLYKSVAGGQEWRGAMRPWEQFSPQTFQRSYADGTLFVDMLSTDAGYFEGRAAEKVGGEWIRYVFHRDKKVRPAGYVGLRQACVSCHASIHEGGPGSGEYGGAEVPGGDTIISAPLAALEP